jgi:hypothetical protein
MVGRASGNDHRLRWLGEQICRSSAWAVVGHGEPARGQRKAVGNRRRRPFRRRPACRPAAPSGRRGPDGGGSFIFEILKIYLRLDGENQMNMMRRHRSG